MVSKSKKIVALILTAMMAASALAGCASGSSGTTTTPSTPATTSSKTDEGSQAGGEGSTTEASKVEAANLDSDEVMAKIKDKMAEEAAATDGTITMTVWCSSDDKSFEEGLMKEFEEKYADTRYSFRIKKSPIGEDKAGGKILEGPKDGADVFSFADDQLAGLVEAGAIAEVANIFNNNVKAENSEKAVEVCTVNGTSYAFPKTSDNGYFMYYDKTVFTDEDVQSFDAMIAKAKEAGKAVFFEMGNAWYNAGFFFTAGCTIKYENGVQTATLNSDEGVAAVKAMCHIAENIGSGFEGDPGSAGANAFIAQGFKDGKLAAAVTGTWNGPAIKEAIGDANVGAAKLPTVLMNDEQKQLDSFGGYKLIGVNAYTKYPITAQALAYYLGKAESQVKRYNVRGLIPTATAALEEDAIKNDVARIAIAAQEPFSHAQGQSVAGKFWGAGVGGYGGDILNAKGKMDEAKIRKDLAKIEAKMK